MTPPYKSHTWRRGAYRVGALRQVAHFFPTGKKPATPHPKKRDFRYQTQGVRFVKECRGTHYRSAVPPIITVCHTHLRRAHLGTPYRGVPPTQSRAYSTGSAYTRTESFSPPYTTGSLCSEALNARTRTEARQEQRRTPYAY